MRQEAKCFNGPAPFLGEGRRGWSWKPQEQLTLIPEWEMRLQLRLEWQGTMAEVQGGGLQTGTAMENREDSSSDWSKVTYEASCECLPGTLRHKE